MKQLIILIVFITMFNIRLFSESAYARNSLSIDFAPMFKFVVLNGWGLALDYELSLGDDFSLGFACAYGNFSFNKTPMSSIMPSASFRYYISRTAPAGGWAGLKYSGIVSIALGITYYDSVISIQIGYKWIIGEFTGFFLEPYFGYMVTISDRVDWSMDPGLKIGWSF